MAESDEETRSPTQKLMRGVTLSGRESPMDLDVDLDVSWLRDQIPFISNPMSPLLLSSSSSFDLPSSPPLWGFPDGKDGNNNAFTAGTAVAGCTQFIISDNPDTANEKQTNGDKRSAVPSLLELRPLENPDGSCLIKERMMLALRYFKDSSEQHILAQVWAPIKSGGRYVLTTSGQPFVLDIHSNGLHQYRMVSLTYMFSADGGESNGELGLPGRVFQQKLPEWTPNVQYYSSKEYPRLNHALNHNVQGTLALPVFETSGQSCIGVLELIMTKPKINYAPDVDKVCKALEAVNLKSSEILDRSSTQICNEGRQKALAEILEILIVACETHKLPLAQTWVPCRHRSVLVDGGGLKKNCTSFDGSCMGQVCMSTIDTAVYIIDAHIWGFREACSEHHLQKGQGVAGRAFSSHNLCFCSDITQFSKKEYPLAHYARLFGLTGCLAICLRSSHTGNDEYVLEFFLPPNIRDSREQETLLESLLATMRQHFQSLEVVKPVKESGGEISIEVIKSSTGEELHSALEFITMPRASESPNGSDALPRGGDMLMKIHPLANESMVEVNALDDGGNVASVCGSHQAVSVSEKKDTKKTLERKRGKAEKSISLEVLQNYFAGSLKEAAKSLGVCPTTMKRICRQHGISRWPSRKIKKVNRSLSKLQHVIESVQGAQGAISLNAFASNPLPATVGSFSWPASVAGSNQPNSRSSKPSELDREDTEMHTCKTPGNEEQDVTLGYEELIHENRSKTKSATKEESSGTPASHGSCHSSPANITAPANDLFVASPGRNHVESGGALRFLFQEQLDMNSLADSSIYYEEPFGGMLTGDAGSSKDLRNDSDTLFDERLSPHMAPEEPVDALAISGSPITTRQDLKDTTIKATYGEDIIRFRFSLTSGIVALHEEVAKRLKLEAGTFEIKYLDDDCELVLIACDADLDECMDISRSSGRNIVRLSVHDITANLGSSCESSWD